jgi:hypothetical protein
MGSPVAWIRAILAFFEDWPYVVSNEKSVTTKSKNIFDLDFILQNIYSTII